MTVKVGEGNRSGTRPEHDQEQEGSAREAGKAERKGNKSDIPPQIDSFLPNLDVSC